MRMEWSDDDLVALWTLVGEDWSLVGNKTGATRLGFAGLLKFFEIEARFPRPAEEAPPAAVAYLTEEVCPVEPRDEQQREALLVRCRTERIEPPGRLDRIIGSARTAFEKRFCELTCSRLDQECADRLEALLVDESGSGRGGLLAERKADPGQVSRGSACVRAGGFSFGGVGAPGR